MKESMDSEVALAPTVCGADVELANFILAGDDEGGADDEDRSVEAALRVLVQVDGVRPRRFARRSLGADVRATSRSDMAAAERTRVWLPANGGCIYIDMGHVELCLPEVASAYDHCAAWHAMLRIARAAAERASEALTRGETIELIANNSDGRSNSYGGHLDFLVQRGTWDAVCRKAGTLLFLASHHASSVVYTGAGKVGSENGRAAVAYQISQRADYIESLFGYQTTYARPLVNTRDEPLCGTAADRRSPEDLARLHVIHCDTGLCHGAQVLKVGVEQVVLAMLAAGQVDRALLLDDPVDAIVAWSHDPSLRRWAMLVGGEEVTAVDLQRRYLDAALVAREAGMLVEVPRVDEILALWDDTLTKLAAGDFPALARRLDWVLKREILVSQCDRPEDWADDPRAKHIDLQYAALGADRGLYWAYEEAGVLEPQVDEDAVARLVVNAPHDTRAYARSLALRAFGDEVWDVDWDYVRVRTADGSGDLDLDLDDPRDPRFGTDAPGSGDDARVDGDGAPGNGDDAPRNGDAIESVAVTTDPAEEAGNEENDHGRT